MKYVIENMRSGDAGHPPFYAGPDTSRSAWKVIQDAAREHYEPGRFTTILAFEWSATLRRRR